MFNGPEMHTQIHHLNIRQLNEHGRASWRLPAYQRPLVWAPEQALALVESVYEGYPIGSLLVWERTHDDHVLLDGQQRLAALTGIRCGTEEPGPQIGWSFVQEKWCLDPSDTSDDWMSIRWWFEVDSMGRLHELSRLQDKYDPNGAKSRDGPWAIALYAFDRLESCVAPIHLLERATPAQAVEAFRRLNTTGTPFDLDELASLLDAEAGGSPPSSDG